MVWFKVDDGLAFHTKTIRAGNAAMGLWVRAGSWCAQHLTDGRIPVDIALTLGNNREISKLVLVGLWEKTGEFYIFHEWTAMNPSRSEVEEHRKRERDKKATARAARRAGQKGLSPGDSPGYTPGESPGYTPGDSPGVSVEIPEGVPPGVPGGVRSTRPDPTRPDPTRPTDSGSVGLVDAPPDEPRERGHRLPEDWTPDQVLIDWAIERGFNTAQVQELTDRFCDHWHGATGQAATKRDWRAAWRNWVGKEDPRKVRGTVTVGRSSNGTHRPDGKLMPWEL